MREHVYPGGAFGGVIRPIQIAPEIAEQLSLRPYEPRTRMRSARKQRRFSSSKTAGGRLWRSRTGPYEDFVEGKVTEEFWRRKSEAREADPRAVDIEIAPLRRPRPLATVAAARIIELAKQAEFRYKSQVRTEQRRLLETVLSNCTFVRAEVCDPHALPRSICSSGRMNRKLAERVGFEPTVGFPLHTLSKRAPSTTRTSLRF